MWSEVDKEALDREFWLPTPPSTETQIRQMVVMVRLELHNRSKPCGPKAIRKWLDEQYRIHPLPSERAIARILAKEGLTYGRTGCPSQLNPGRNDK